MTIEPAINCPIDCGVATTSEFSRQFTKQTVSNRTADLNFFIENVEIEAGSVSSVVLGDINYSRETFSVSATNYRVSVDFLPERFASIESIESGDNSILEQSANDLFLFEYQSTGSTTLTTTFNTNEKITKSFTTLTESTSETQNTFVSFLNNSLGNHIFDQMRQYADNTTSPPNHYPLYTTFDFSNNNYVRNTSHWSHPLDFSGLMVNKSGSGGVTMVTAVTPHHAVGVSHYRPEVGDTIVFCDLNNQTVTRQVQSVGLIPAIDFVVVRFSEALPETVKKYKLLPSNYEDYLPLNRDFKIADGSIVTFRCGYLPVVITSHYRWDADWPLQRPNRYAYIYQTGRQLEKILSYLPANTEPNNFSTYDGTPSNIRGGDSGGPSFFVINNDLVLASVHVTSTSGTFISSFLSQAQEKIDELGPSGQTIQTVDLSGFTDFSS
jgi:hypothetical protein